MAEWVKLDPADQDAWTQAVAHARNFVEGLDEQAQVTWRTFAYDTLLAFARAVGAQLPGANEVIPSPVLIVWEAVVRHLVNALELDTDEQEQDLGEHEASWEGWARQRLAQLATPEPLRQATQES